MAHVHPITDSDTIFKIDPLTKQITNGGSKSTLVQFDHNSERFTFEIPRYVEGHDMSQCDSVKVHFVNTDTKGKLKSIGEYTVSDLNVSQENEDTVMFSWLIRREATVYAGTLWFEVQFTCFADAEIDYQWNTDSYKKIRVLESIHIGGIVQTAAYYVVGEPKEVTLTLANWVGTSYNLKLTGYRIGEHGVQVGLPSTTDTTNAQDAITASLTIRDSYSIAATSSAEAYAIIVLSAIAHPMRDLTITLFGLEEVVTE